MDIIFLHLDDHVNGLATLARLGKAIPHTYIIKITDSGGKTVDEWKQPQGNQVLKEDAAYIVNDMASDPRASYLSGINKFHRYKGWNFGIKTGTTNNGFDGLMTSWSTQYAAVAWVGYHTRNQPLRGFMETMTAPITRPWMQGAHDMLKTNPTNWARPSGVKSVPAFVVRNHVGIASIEPSPSTDIAPGWYTGNVKNSGPQTIDIVSNKLATDCTPGLARKTDTNANSNNFSIDIFVAGGSASGGSTEKDDVHKCSDSKPSVSIASAPSNCSDSCTIYVNASAGTHPLSSGQFPGTLNVRIGGQTVKSFQIDGPVSNYGLTFNYDGHGSQEVSVQVIDSVLYDSSDSVTISFSGGGGGPLNQSPTGGVVAKSSVVFSWSGGSPNYTVHATCLTGNQKSGIGGTSYNPPDGDLHSGSCEWWVEDSNGDESSHSTFTVF